MTDTLDWDENNQPVSKTFDDIYFSTHNGLEESRYVFIQHNQLEERWSALCDDTSQNSTSQNNTSQNNTPKNNTPKNFTIAETGFGTGLNFIATWQHWRQHPIDNTLHRLNFISFEKFPLCHEDIKRAAALWPSLSQYYQQLIEIYPPISHGNGHFHTLFFDNGRVALTLFWGDAKAGLDHLCLPQLSARQLQVRTDITAQKDYIPCRGEVPLNIDAWFFDGFTPVKNPDLWQEDIFTLANRLSHKQTTFATFTAVGFVRRALTASGFKCRKTPGFGKKREMLSGRVNTLTNPAASVSQLSLNSPQIAELEQTLRSGKKKQTLPLDKQSHWAMHLKEPQKTDNPSVMVIGGGLAGCSTAFALARRGTTVTLIEEHTIASGASGNVQGAVYCKHSPYDNPASQFNIQAQLFADRFYKNFGFYQQCGSDNGVLHLATDDHSLKVLSAFYALHGQTPQYYRWLNPDQASRVSGVKLRQPGLFLPRSGWLSPPQLCEHYLKHPNIRIRQKQSVAELQRKDHHWNALDKDGNIVHSAELVVIANATQATHLIQTQQLPLKPIRGQVSHINETQKSEQLQVVLCGEGYIPPAYHLNNQKIHCTGATFTLDNKLATLHEKDHAQNLSMMQNTSESFQQNRLIENTDVPQGRVGFRCTTPDYLPIVGPVPKNEPLNNHFRYLSKNASTCINQFGSRYPGLYCNVGHGSRGLAYTPMCSEILAALIHGEALPINRFLYEYLHPARFTIKKLKKSRL